jgi:glucose-fructose oxidoreductase
MSHPQLPPTRRSFLQHLALAGGAVLTFGRSARATQPGADRKLGVALVGLGNYSRGELAPALKQTQWCRLAGVVTGDRTKGERWAREHGFPTRSIYDYDTMHQLADNDTIDIVYVVTPPGLHARDSIAAARAGKHVICEKPMANTVAECDAIIAACREAGVMLSIGYRLQFDPYHQTLDRMVQERGAFPRMSGGFGFPMRGRSWRVEKRLSGGGPLMDVGIYVIQAACRGAGNVAPVAVTARERPKTNPELFREVEETLDFTLHFPDGECQGTTSYAESSNRFRGEHPNAFIELQPAYSYRGLGGRTHQRPLEFPPINQQALQMDDFARAILDRRPTPVPGEQGRMHMAVVEAIYESARRNGERIPVKA